MKLRPFELVLIVVFGSLFFVALFLLRNFDGGEPAEDVSNLGAGLTIWGVLPYGAMESLLQKMRDTDEGYNNVTYRYVAPEEFDQVFVNALADQKGPDLLLLPHDRLVKHRTRLQPIPYESFPVRDFRSTYIDGAEIFALSDGIYGLPVAVDPLVMYWNRDIFSTNGLLSAPTTWEEVVNTTVPTLTVRDFNRNIQLSAVAMGEYRNISNAFPVLSLLLLQGGSVMVTEGQNQYRIRLDETVNQSGAQPFVTAATFYTNFSNVSNTLYSWNRALTLDKDRFLSEDLALYFGYLSEGRDIAAKNPNLNFDVAEVPQGASATVKRTYGQYYAFVIPKTAPNKAGALTAMQTLGGETNAKQIADGYNFAPAHRSTLAVGSNDVYGRVGYASAVYARGWLNPDLDRLSPVLTTMLEDINANRSDIGSATSDAVNRIQQIY